MFTNKDSGIDFKDQHFYIGMDVHKKQWTVSIRHKSLMLKTFSMDPSPEKLLAFLEDRYPGGLYHTAYEAGFCGFWICRRLRELGIDCVVVNPADIPSADKEKDRKMDPVDAGKLARELEKGELECIYVPQEQEQNLRSLCRLYTRTVTDATRVKNRIKGHLHFNGVRLPRHTSQWSGKFITHLKTLSLDDGPARDYLLICLEQLEMIRSHTVSILKKLRLYLQDRGRASIFRNLLTVPGIGFKSAIIVYTEIIDMSRFPTQDQLKSFVGLVPSTRASGEMEYDRGLTYRSNRHLKHVLIEAAWVAIRQDPALLQYFNKLVSRMKKQRRLSEWQSNC